MITVSHRHSVFQTENMNKEIKIIKWNQIKILEFESMIIKMKHSLERNNSR